MNPGTYLLRHAVQPGGSQSQEDPRIPFGEWMDQLIDWCDLHLGGLFDVIEWPYRQVLPLLPGFENQGIAAVPAIVFVVAFAGLGYIGGGAGRAVRVGAALGLCTLLGDSMWELSLHSLVVLLLVFATVAPLLALSVKILGRMPRTAEPAHQALYAWSMVHPYAILLPAVFFWGIGTTAGILVCSISVLPAAVAGTAHASEAPLMAQVRSGLRHALPAAMLLLGFLAIVGLGGLPNMLFRALSNQDPNLASQTALAYWLVGYVLWQLLGPWSIAHLPGSGARTTQTDDQEPATGDDEDGEVPRPAANVGATGRSGTGTG